MTLFELVVEKKVKSLSIIGMAKNVGKTVTLNYLIEQSTKRNMVLGLTSAGRDGEKIDAVLEHTNLQYGAEGLCLQLPENV